MMITLKESQPKDEILLVLSSFLFYSLTSFSLILLFSDFIFILKCPAFR